MAIGPLLLVFLILIGVFLGLYLQRSRRRAPSEPSCGHCGYQVRGLTSFTCPECGSDLREVGIMTEAFIMRVGRTARAVIWTTVLVVVALYVTALISGVLPQYYRVTREYGFDRPKSKAYNAIHIVTESSGYQRTPLVHTASLQLKGLMSQAEMLVDLDADPAFSSEQLSQWLEQAGVATESEQVASEIAEIVSVVRGIAATKQIPMAGHTTYNFQSVGGGNLSTYVSRAPWILPLAIPFWLAIWVIGLVRIFRRRKHQTMEVNQTEPAV